MTDDDTIRRYKFVVEQKPDLIMKPQKIVAADPETGLDPTRARLLTDRIKVAIEGAWHLITEAYQARAWVALGYSSWDDYCTREFGTSRLRLPREERQEVVASLRDAGLSIRAIAAATGTGTRQVQSAIRSEVWSQTTPDPEFAELAEALDDRLSRPPADAGDVAPPRSKPSVKPMKPPASKVTGIDGKSYDATPKAEPAKPRRSPLADIAQRAGWDFRKAVERLERIAEDDRFDANREKLDAHLSGHLAYAIDVCPHLLRRVTGVREDEV